MNTLGKAFDSDLWLVIIVGFLLLIPGFGYGILIFMLMGMAGEINDEAGRYTHGMHTWGYASAHLLLYWGVAIAAIVYEHLYIGIVLETNGMEGLLLLPIGMIIAIFPTWSLIGGYIKMSKERYSREQRLNNPS